jgi:hypothetical protein
MIALVLCVLLFCIAARTATAFAPISRHSLLQTQQQRLRGDALQSAVGAHKASEVDSFVPVQIRNAVLVAMSCFLLVTDVQPARALDVLSEVVVPADNLREDKAQSFTQTTVTLPSGVKYYDAVIGSGPVVAEGKSVQFTWVLRRSNGYFVDSNQDFEPFIYKVGNLKKVMKGVDEGIRGMKQGGVRRLNIPAALAFLPGGVNDDAPGPIPSGTFVFTFLRVLKRHSSRFWEYNS